MVRDSGSPRIDAESDFLRARRLHALTSLAARLRGDDDSTRALSFDEVVEALGNLGERRLGLQLIPLDAIVGSVDKVRDFDPEFRPTSGRSRFRWERIAEAVRRGQGLPPIDVYQVGDQYFVRDGHHRVSVAVALGLRVIDAHVTRVDTVVSAGGIETRAAIDHKHWQRIFLQRVPLPHDEREAIEVTNPVAYGLLAEMVEAWSARTMYREEAFSDRRTMARRWFAEEFVPVLELVDEAGVRGSDETAADAYMRVAAERYRLIREHAWDLEVMKRVKREGRRGAPRL